MRISCSLSMKSLYTSCVGVFFCRIVASKFLSRGMFERDFPLLETRTSTWDSRNYYLWSYMKQEHIVARRKDSRHEGFSFHWYLGSFLLCLVDAKRHSIEWHEKTRGNRQNVVVNARGYFAFILQGWAFVFSSSCVYLTYVMVFVT